MSRPIPAIFAAYVSPELQATSTMNARRNERRSSVAWRWFGRKLARQLPRQRTSSHDLVRDAPLNVGAPEIPPELTHHAGIQVARVKSPFNTEPLIMAGEVAWRD